MQWSGAKYISGEELTMSTIASSGAVIPVRATCLLLGISKYPMAMWEQAIAYQRERLPR